MHECLMKWIQLLVTCEQMLSDSAAAVAAAAVAAAADIDYKSLTDMIKSVCLGRQWWWWQQ